MKTKNLEEDKKEYLKHNKLKWTLKSELDMLTFKELVKIKKLIVSFYKQEESNGIHR